MGINDRRRFEGGMTYGARVETSRGGARIGRGVRGGPMARIDGRVTSVRGSLKARSAARRGGFTPRRAGALTLEWRIRLETQVHAGPDEWAREDRPGPYRSPGAA